MSWMRIVRVGVVSLFTFVAVLGWGNGTLACDIGFADCDGLAGNGCEANLNERTARTGGASSPAYPISGYTEGITNCGACGVTCDDGNPCTTDLCVDGGAGLGVCRHFNRKICAAARCSGSFVPEVGDVAGDQSACADVDSDGDNIPDAWEVSSIDPYTEGTNPAGIDINCDGAIDGTHDFLYPPGEEPNLGTKDVYLRIRAMGQRPGSFDIGPGSSGAGCITDDDCVIFGDGLHNWCDQNSVNNGFGLCSDEPATGHGLLPGVIPLLKNAFLLHGITLHVDYDPFSVIAHADYLKFFADDVCGLGAEASATYFADGCHHEIPIIALKVPPFWDFKLRYVYHFAVLAHDWCVNLNTSGNAEILGNDFSITLGNVPFSFSDADRLYIEAGALMHELGHNLGLTHPSPLRGPNVLSVMNYRYEFAGIYTADQPITDPPTTSSGIRRIDFSTDVLPTLDENDLDENLILKPGSTDVVTFNCPGGVPRKGLAGAPINWNCNGFTGDPHTGPVNIDGTTPVTYDVHVGREEWSTLQYNFQCQASFADFYPPGEVCDGIDNNCNSLIDEDFPNLGAACGAGVGQCRASGVYVCAAGGSTTQCNAVPGSPAPETCDGLDNDCDGSTDEDFPNLGASCTAGEGQCQRTGVFVCSTGGSTTQCDAVQGNPVQEICDGLDNDCDGSADEDGDGDGFGVCFDCNDLLPGSFTTPGEVLNLRFPSESGLAWDPPSAPGGTSVRYDTISSPSPTGFVSNGTCVETDDGSDTQAPAGSIPPMGVTFYYLTRAENDCVPGQGPLGNQSDGTPRTARSCP
jgi:putative metal-binding protein